MTSVNQLFGDTLLTKNGYKTTTELLANKKRTALYFSADYCAPCHRVTPVISEFYDSLNEENDTILEVIFVSLDSDMSSFNSYYSKMPFAAIPFSNKSTIDILRKRYDIKTIPTLIVVETSTGRIVDVDGVSTIVNCNGNLGKATMKW